nr:uncharacterized protein LOC107175359 [Ipomoea batatas]
MKHIAEDKKIDVASFYMVGQRFGPSSYVNHRATLFKLTQRTSVAAYQFEFESVSNRVTDLHPAAMLDCFILDLKPVIQNELAVHKPATLSDAIVLAKFRSGHRCQTKPFLLLLADDPDDGGADSATFEACDKDIDAECDDTMAKPGAPFEADFHVLEFSGANAVLGVQWLEGLGRVVRDHKALTMEFEHQGRLVKLVRT